MSHIEPMTTCWQQMLVGPIKYGLALKDSYLKRIGCTMELGHNHKKHQATCARNCGELMVWPVTEAETQGATPAELLRSVRDNCFVTTLCVRSRSNSVTLFEVYCTIGFMQTKGWGHCHRGTWKVEQCLTQLRQDRKSIQVRQQFPAYCRQDSPFFTFSDSVNRPHAMHCC